MNRIHILLPVLNEELRVWHGMAKTVEFMELNFPDRYLVTVVDNGSTDKTGEIVEAFIRSHANVRYKRLDERGVGVAVRAGAMDNECEIIGYMDIDLSTKLDHLLEVDRLFTDQNVDIVNGSRLSRGSVLTGRKASRMLTSHGLKYLLRLTLGMKIDDAICGFKFFRNDVLQKLILFSSDTPGWFFCIELMIRAEKMGFLIKEIPVLWEDDLNTTVNVKKIIKEYIIGIWRLFREFHKKN